MCPLCDRSMTYWQNSTHYGYMCPQGKCGYEIIEKKED